MDLTLDTAFKKFEFGGWQQSVNAYDLGFSKLTSNVGETMLRVLELEPGATFLDVACGPGHVTERAHQFGAVATGVDFSPQMLERAASKYKGPCFQPGDAEALPFGDESFDCVGMNFGIPHLGDPEAALFEMHRVVKSGGRIAFSAWGLPTEALGFKVVLDAVNELGDRSVSLPPGPSFFKFSAEDEARSLCDTAGFQSFAVEQVPGSWKFEKFDDFFTAFHEGTARTGGLLRAQPPEYLARIRERVEQTLMAGFSTDGISVEVPMPAKVYWAVK